MKHLIVAIVAVFAFAFSAAAISGSEGESDPSINCQSNPGGVSEFNAVTPETYPKLLSWPHNDEHCSVRTWRNEEYQMDMIQFRAGALRPAGRFVKHVFVLTLAFQDDGDVTLSWHVAQGRHPDARGAVPVWSEGCHAWSLHEIELRTYGGIGNELNRRVLAMNSRENEFTSGTCDPHDTVVQKEPAWVSLDPFAYAASKRRGDNKIQPVGNREPDYGWHVTLGDPVWTRPISQEHAALRKKMVAMQSPSSVPKNGNIVYTRDEEIIRQTLEDLRTSVIFQAMIPWLDYNVDEHYDAKENECTNYCNTFMLDTYDVLGPYSKYKGEKYYKAIHEWLDAT